MSRNRKPRPAKRQKLSKEICFVDADQANSDQSESDEGQEDFHYGDNAEAKIRLDKIVKAGVISLVDSSNNVERKRPFRSQSRDALTIEMKQDFLDSSDNNSVFKCALCPKYYSSVADQYRHEVIEHFTWVFKPLLMHLLDIIEDEAFYCPSSSCTLRLQLLKCIKSHRTCCPECHYTSDCADSLMEHYKDQHYSEFGQQKNVGDQQVVDKKETPHHSPYQSPYYPGSDFGDVADDVIDYNNDDINDDADSDDWWEPPKQEQAIDTPKDDLNMAQRGHDDKQQNYLICVECGASYSTKHHLDKHLLAKHSKDSTTDQSNQTKHENTDCTRGPSERSLVCDDCGAIYVRRHDLDKHILRRHREGKKSWSCADCGTTYVQRHSLNKHRMMKHSGKEGVENKREEDRPERTEPNQSLLCVECGDTFRRQQALDKHILAEHSRSLKCEKCDFATGCKNKLNKHLIHWHAEMCKDCGIPIESVELEGSFQGNRRSRINTGLPGHVCPAQSGQGPLEGAVEPEEKKIGFVRGMVRVPNGFACTKCGFHSQRSYTLLRHLSLMHAKQNCPIQGCKLVFNTRPMLQEHLKQHHPENCYLCLYEDGISLGEHDCVRRLMLPAPEDSEAKRSLNPMIMHLHSTCRPVGCHLCGELHGSQSRLIQHSYYHHPLKTDNTA